MLKNSKTIALICGAISVAVTIIFYLLTFDHIFTIPMRWLSLMFLILTEIIGTIKAISTEKSIFGVATIVTSIFHLIFVLILSIIYVNIFPLLIKSYVLFNILALCILLMVDVIIIHFAKKIGATNNELAQNQAVADSLKSNAKELLIKYNESDYKKELEEIVDLLDYLDNSTLTGDEVTILNKLEELNNLLEKNDGKASEKIIDVKNTIKLRNVKMESSKRGSY